MPIAVLEIENRKSQIENMLGAEMESSSLKVFSITIRDSRKYVKTKRFTSVALCSEQAIALTKNKAKSVGWKHFDVDQLTCLGDIDAAPWLVENESEVEPCQP